MYPTRDHTAERLAAIQTSTGGDTGAKHNGTYYIEPNNKAQEIVEEFGPEQVIAEHAHRRLLLLEEALEIGVHCKVSFNGDVPVNLTIDLLTELKQDGLEHLEFQILFSL